MSAAPWLYPLIGWAVMAIAMLTAWLVQRRTGDAGIVDAVWTFGVGSLGAIFALASSNGFWPRRVIVAALVGAWSFRLGLHVMHRLRTMPEDGRYVRLKAAWGESAQIKMLGFYQLQAFAAALFAVPMLMAAQASAPLGVWDFAGIAVWLVAIGGETLTDRQLSRFRADASRRGQVCRDGLWRYSRHPNYFFEWLHWWSYVLLALTAPWGLFTAAAPLVMLYFLLFVSGIPPTEAQALRSRGAAYREYQQTTSAFVPWPPKKLAAQFSTDDSGRTHAR